MFKIYFLLIKNAKFSKISKVRIVLTFIILFFLCTTSVSAGDRETGKFYVTAKQGLNIRPEPGKGSIVIVKMPHASQVEILEYSKEEDEIDGNKAPWAKLKYKKYTGWAFSHYLSKEAPK
jgi:hypothetical protein